MKDGTKRAKIAIYDYTQFDRETLWELRDLYIREANSDAMYNNPEYYIWRNKGDAVFAEIQRRRGFK